MQRLIQPPAPNALQVNRWIATRRNTHIRKLYRLFYAISTSLSPQVKDWETLLAPLLDHSTRGNLYELQDLCQNLFADDNQEEPYGFHFHWAVQALFNSSIKLQANLRMVAFHQQHQHPGQNDPGHIAFITAINEEIDNQTTSLALLLDNGRNLLRLMLCEHTANDLLLRLIIEDEEMTEALWNQSSLSLFTEMFPDQPEAGYMQAGKSYFMGQWLKEALQCYEISLKINNNLSEPRKQASVIRAMLTDLETIALRRQAP